MDNHPSAHRGGDRECDAPKTTPDPGHGHVIPPARLELSALWQEWPQAAATLRRWLGQRVPAHVADDIVQQVAEAALRTHPTFAERAKVRSWCWGTAARLAAKWHRDNRRLVVVGEVPDVVGDHDPVAEGFERRHDALVAFQRLREAVAGMSSADQVAIRRLLLEEPVVGTRRERDRVYLQNKRARDRLAKALEGATAVIVRWRLRMASFATDSTAILGTAATGAALAGLLGAAPATSVTRVAAVRPDQAAVRPAAALAALARLPAPPSGGRGAITVTSQAGRPATATRPMTTTTTATQRAYVARVEPEQGPYIGAGTMENSAAKPMACVTPGGPAAPVGTRCVPKPAELARIP
jgi:hypothetical protein